MKLLIFGKTGQVARELRRRAGSGVVITALDRAAADLANPDACASAIRAHRADAVINAAAYTDVNKAETETETAFLINARAPGAMARAAMETSTPFLHISTDYVFDGSGTASHRPGHPTGPLGVYGRSKLAGEEAVRGSGGVHAILRTSWVFSAHGANFVKTMLRLGAERDSLRIVSDQVGGPTAAAHIAEALLVMADELIRDPGKSGTYHFAGAPDIGWNGFAREIFAQAGLSVAVDGIATADYPTPAPRPLNSRLDCGATEAVFGIHRPDWRTGLADVLRELSGSGR